MAKVLMVVAQQGFKDEEYLVPREILEKAGHTIKVASIARAKATGVGGTSLTPDMAVYEANADFFDAIIIVGGPGSRALAGNEDVLDLLRSAHGKGNVVAAICLAPMALANAGLLNGKRATVFPDKDAIATLKNGGARYTEEGVVVADRIVTADAPHSANDFGLAIAGLLG